MVTFCRKRSVPVPHSHNMTILDPFSGHNVAGRVGVVGIRKFQDAFLKGLTIVSAGSEYEKLFQTFQWIREIGANGSKYEKCMYNVIKLHCNLFSKKKKNSTAICVLYFSDFKTSSYWNSPSMPVNFKVWNMHAYVVGNMSEGLCRLCFFVSLMGLLLVKLMLFCFFTGSVICQFALVGCYVEDHFWTWHQDFLRQVIRLLIFMLSFCIITWYGISCLI